MVGNVSSEAFAIDSAWVHHDLSPVPSQSSTCAAIIIPST